MKQTDTLQHFMFEHASVRGGIAHLDTTFQTIMSQHPYPEQVKVLLGEALVSCVLLAGSIKFEGEISLQFHGDKRLPLLVVQCDHQLQVRAYAKYEQEEEGVDYQGAFLLGKMVFSIQQQGQNQIYQSVVPIRSVSMSENIAHYFAQSEQIATQVWLAVSETQAAGMLLQLMPEEGNQHREQFWEYAVQVGQTISEQELFNLDNQTILHRLYHETPVRIFPTRPVAFCCRCDAAKMKQVFAVLGEDEANQLLQERGIVEITCDFCNQQYRFDSIDIALLFRESP